MTPCGGGAGPGGHLSARRGRWPPAGAHRRPRPGSRPEGARGGEDGVLLRWGQGVLLLGVELDDQLLLHGGVDHLTRRDAVHQHLELAADDLQPRRHGALAGTGGGDLERHHLARLLGDLDDVVGAHPVGRDVDLAAVHPDVAVAHQLASHVAGLSQAGPVDHVVQPRLEDLEQNLTGLAGLLVGLFVVAAELLLQHAVDAAGLLLLAQLEQVLAVLAAAPAVLARRVGPDLDRALRGLALAALEEQLHLFAPAHAAVGSGVTGHVRYSSFFSSVAGQTRRRFLGRQPLCGCGVTSWIWPTSRPVACSERIAVSRPEPGPLTKTSTLRMPCSCALRAAFSAAICAANGVDLREPFPAWPTRAAIRTSTGARASPSRCAARTPTTPWSSPPARPERTPSTSHSRRWSPPSPTRRPWPSTWRHGSDWPVNSTSTRTATASRATCTTTSSSGSSPRGWRCSRCCPG